MVELSSLKSEMDFVELGLLDQPFSDNVAVEFRSWITRQKVPKPFTKLHAWFVQAVPQFTHKCQNFDTLCQWIVYTSLFVSDFEPPAFKYTAAGDEEHSFVLPGIIKDIIIPGMKKNEQAQKIVNDAKDASKDARHTTAGTTLGATQDTAEHAHLLLAQLEERKQVAIQQEDYSTAQVLKEQIMNYRQQRGPTSAPIHNVLPQLEQQKAEAVNNEQYDIAHEVQQNINQVKSSMQCGSAHVAPMHGAYTQPTVANKIMETEATLATLKLQAQKEAARPTGSWAPEAGIRLPPQGTTLSDPDYPQYVWDERLRQIVDVHNPQLAFTHPDHFCPNPKLNHWKPSLELHEMERRRVAQLQEVQGFMYQAIKEKESVTWPKHGVHKDTPWGELTPFQRALALVEQSLTWSALKQKSVSNEVARDYMGLTTFPIEAATIKEMAKLGAAQQKASESLAKQAAGRHRPSGEGKQGHHEERPKPWRGKEWKEFKQQKSDVECFYCHQKGHMQFQCPKKSPKDKAVVEAAKKRIAQLEHAAGEATDGSGGVH